MLNDKNKQAAVRRHVPQRSCVTCRQTTNKWSLIRLVRTGDNVVIDPRGKMPGRGAYLCPSFECWEQALKKSRLNYVLRMKITEETRSYLAHYAEGFPKEERANA